MTDQTKGKKEFKVLEVEGILFYPKVHKPEVNKFAKPINGKAPSPEYSVEIVVDNNTFKLLKAEGLPLATKQSIDEETEVKSFIPKEHVGFEGKKVYKFKRKTIKADGSPNSPLPVVDSQLVPIPSTTLIGNGSRGVLSINPWSMIGSDGKVVHGANLLAVQVLDLVPYTAQEQKLSFKKRDGFIVDNTNNDPVRDSITEFSSGDLGDENANF